MITTNFIEDGNIMIKLKQILKESIIKLDLNKIKGITFSTYSQSNLVIFIPRTSKDLDLMSETGWQNHEVQQALSSFCQDKTKLSWAPNTTYQGAGYAVQLDMDSLLKKIK